MAGKVYVGDVGTRIVLRTGQSLTGAIELGIRVRKPDKTEVVWPATADADGGVVHVSDATTFNIPGTYLMQASVELASGQWLGETAKLRVYPPFG